MSEMNKDETTETTNSDTVTRVIEIARSPLAKDVGDYWEQYRTSRNVITKCNANVKLMARQYLKKNGELGKLTLTFMQNEEENVEAPHPEEKKRLYHLVEKNES